MQGVVEQQQSYIRWFETLRLEDLDAVGGKNAALGELMHALRQGESSVPRGFALTVRAWSEFLAQNRLRGLIEDGFSGIAPDDQRGLFATAARIRESILEARIPAKISDELETAYSLLCRRREGRKDVAVRSSATAEDLPSASFAGQMDSFLNVEGERALVEKVRECFASLFTDRAVKYRAERGFDQTSAAISVGVQEMVRSDLSVSGVMFTLEPESGFRDLILINSTYGLGETLVKGMVIPDEFHVFKKTLTLGCRPILKRAAGSKEQAMIYDPEGRSSTRLVEVSPEKRRFLTLSDDEVLSLSRDALRIERHFNERRGSDQAMDIEWAKDGITGKIQIVQARPETGDRKRPVRNAIQNVKYYIEMAGPVLAEGRAVGGSIQIGQARVLDSPSRLSELKPGEILVAPKTDPDWGPGMSRAAGVVTNRGGKTCHAAIAARELGIPAIVGTRIATERIRTGQTITISTAEGETGRVYDGAVKYRTETISMDAAHPFRDRILLNLSRPEEAYAHSFLPVAGVGLARMEFIISTVIRMHPLAAIHPERIEDPGILKEIEERTSTYPSKMEFFIRNLSEQVGTLAAAFYPRKVVLRLSDFKTNEYRDLPGGAAFEPWEENPMIGFRGAFRYSHALYREGFALECEAVHRVRIDMGLTNLKIMIPFVRTTRDAEDALQELEKNRLKRGELGLEVWMMCEVPSNALDPDSFFHLFDGFSIGSNDLTQLVFGVDRDSEVLEGLFNDTAPPVLELIRRVISAARRQGKPVSICGEAPSNRPEFARMLLQEGMDTISINPDALGKVLAFPTGERTGRTGNE